MRFVARLPALLAALALGAAAPPDPLAAVAQAHPAALHLRAAGAAVADGRRAEVTLDVMGARALLRRCIGGVCAGRWFDGERSWTFGLNEVPLPDDTDESIALRRTLAAAGSGFFADPAFRANGGLVEPAGPHAWRVRAAGGATLIAVLDAHDRNVERVLTEQGTLVATYEQFVPAGPAGATFALARSGLDAGRFDTVGVVDGPLEPPNGAPATFDGVPALALAAEPIPNVPCTLGTRPARCVLDSGATPSAITLPFAEALGLEPRGELEITASSRFATGFVDAGPLVLGAARFAHVRLAVIPAVAGANVDVVVGADLLANLRVVLDRAHARARIEAPPEVQEAASGPRLSFSGGVPFVDAVIDGHQTRALLDTGDAATVSIGYADYREGPQWPLTGRATARGVAGAADTLLVQAPDVRLGAVDFGPTTIEVNRTQAGAHIGIGIWSRCLVTLDERGARLGCEAPR